MHPAEPRPTSVDQEIEEPAVDLTLDTPEGYPWLQAVPPEGGERDDAESE